MRRTQGRKTSGGGLGTNNLAKKWVSQKHSHKLVRAVCEAIEDRVMLSAVIRPNVPASVTPSTIPQTLLAPGNISTTLTPSTTTTAVSASFRFTVNNATAGELTQFSTVEATNGTPTDSAIALYDASGNQIVLQDADPSGSLANETLNVALTSGQQYEVDFLAKKISANTAQAITLNINPGPQNTGSTVTLNPSFNSGTLTTSSPPNSFTSSTSVRYFPISFLNGGASGSIQITAAGPDASVDATLYQLPTNTFTTLGSVPTWKQVTTGSTAVGGSTTLTVTPTAGTDVTDGNYVLALAPLNFTAAPEPVTITAAVSGGGLSAVAANPANVVSAVPQALTAVGTVGGTISSNVVGSAAKLYSVTAPLTGTMFVTYQPDTYNPLLAVYSPGGTSLLAVASATSGGASASASFAAVAGQTYYLSAGVDAQPGVNDTFTLTTSQQYTSTPIAVTSTLGQTTGLNLAQSAGASFFQLTPAAGSNYVALQIVPTAGLTVQATVIGPSQAAQTTTATGAGQPLTVLINESGNPGPYDVMLTSTAGTGTATFKYVTLTVPQTIAIGQLPTQPLNLALGGLSLPATAIATGTLTGAQYYLPASTGTPTPSTYTAQASSGAVAIVLHYVQVGAVLQLADSAVSTVGGLASVSKPASTQTLHAIAALAVNFSGTSTVQLAVAGPLPTGIGLGFVPNALPGQGPPAAGFQSGINLTGVALTSAPQIDLYSTQLPFNLTGTSATLNFSPVDVGGPLHANITVLSGTNAIIATGTNTAGQPLGITLTSLTPGETLRFEVTAVPGSNLGSGKYALGMTVNTTDPRPYLVTQGSFLPFSSSPAAGQNYFPQNLVPTVLPFGPTGVVGNFTSSTPYNPTNGTGSIQVFEFSAPTLNYVTFPQTFQVTTTDLDPNINTNIALFYQNPSSSTPNTYIPVPGTSVNFDYYPGDRSSVDARIIDINTDTMPQVLLGEFNDVLAPIYVVVMNEQGTQGHYNISATAVPTPAIVGPGTGVPANVLPFAPSSGAADLNPASLTVHASTNSQTFGIRTPVDVSSSSFPILTITGGTSGQSVTATITTIPRPPFAPLVQDTGSSTFNSSGVATISIASAGPSLPYAPLGSGVAYNLAVTTTSGTFPAGGLTLGDLTIGRAAVTPIASATPANYPLADGFNANISRIDPAPNGTFSDALSFSGSSVTAEFSVSTAGPVTIHMAFNGGSNVTLGLYQSGEHATVVSQFTTTYASDGVLLDSQNTISGGLYTINANLLPGTYFVVGANSITFLRNSGSATFTGTLPAFQATVLTVNPTTGNNTVAEETTVNPNSFNSGGETDEDSPFFDYRYNSNFYTFTAPANVTGAPISVFLADTATNVPVSPATGYGNINVTIWKDVNGVFTYINGSFPAIKDSGTSGYVDGAIVFATGDTTTPGAVYYIGIDMNGYENSAYIGVDVPIITSGLPDYSVQPVVLTADSGKTLITSSIINESYTGAPASSYLLQEGSLSSSRLLFPLAPFGTYPISLDWNPGALTDVVSVTADQNSTVAELSETNNFQSTALNSVDHFTPTATIKILDTHMSAESPTTATTGGGTWGRYISGVTGQRTTIEVDATDGGGSGLYQVSALGPPDNNTSSWIFGNQTFTNGSSQGNLDFTVDFGDLNPTSGSNPNNIKFAAIDAFGLAAPVTPQHLDVIAAPSFLTGGLPVLGTAGAGGSIVFSENAGYKFTYAFQDALISYSNTVDGLLDATNLPVVGEEPVSLLVAINANGTGGLDPTQGVQLTVGGQLTIMAVNQKLLDKQYTAADVGNNFSFASQMILSGSTLLPGSVSVSLQLSKLKLFQVQTPLIPIITLGIPGVLSVDAGVKFGLAATLSAGAKIGSNPVDLSSASDYLASLGLMSPTFIEPSLTASATVAGQVDVLGFDVASLSGTVGLSLNLAIGLDNSNPNAIFTPSDALHSLAIDVNASLSVTLAASIPIIGNIFSYTYNQNLGNIVNTVQHGIFLTDPPSTATGKFIAPGTPPGQAAPPPATVITVSGSSLVGAYPIDPSPQIAIDNTVTNGKALSVQLINAGTGGSPVANLSVSSRTGGVWTSLSTLSEPNDVSSPELALTHDAGSAVPAMVVYDVDNVAGSPATQTINQRLDSEDIAYRYYDGTNWGPEIRVTTDGLYDSEPQIAFNATGAGALAYVHNTDSVPMNASGQLDSASNDVVVRGWDPVHHTWFAPTTLDGSDGVSDSSPSTFVDASGVRYVVWIRGTGISSQLMFSTSSDGINWSAAAPLALTGLAAGGTFNNVTMGSDAAGHVDVVFSYSVTNADGTVTTTLYNRLAAAAGFTTAQPLVPLAANSNFSNLHTTGGPNNSMVVYWEQSDGQTNQIFETTVASGVESGPFQISDDQDLATSPSAAMDGNGKLQLLYDNKVAFGGSPTGFSPTDPTVGSPLAPGVYSSSVQNLPQFTFTSGLSFPASSGGAAATGSTVTGSAVIANRGTAAANVTLTGYDGIAGSGGTAVGTPQTFTLAPGQSLSVSQAFTVLAGNQTYSFQLTTAGAQAFDTTENLSTATLNGEVDIAATQLTSDSPLTPGSAATLDAYFQNNSTTAITTPFTVTLYSGDPLSAQFPVTVLATQTVNSMSSQQQMLLTFPVTVPAGSGDDVYTFVVDSGNVITESNENNNEARDELNVQSDPAVVPVVTGPTVTPAVTATQVNTTGANDVQVTVNVTNLGSIALANVPVDLTVSRNGGAFISLGQMTIASLAPGANIAEIFTVSALAGDDVFVGSIDPSAFLQDSNLTNDIGTAELNVQGLPTLGANLSLSRSASVAGTALTLTATVNNTGLADGTSVPLTVLATLTSGGPSTIIGTGVTSVTGLSSQAVQIALNTAGLAPGLYTITLEIDPNHTVIQGTDAGNIVTTSEILLVPNLDVITGTSAIDGITLIQDIDHSHIDWTLNGTSGGQMSITDAAGLTINGNGLNDTIFLDYTNGNPLPNKLNLSGIFTLNNLAATGNPLAGTTIDIKTSTVFITYSAPASDPMALIQGYLKTGFNGDAWTGTSAAGAINSSAAAANKQEFAVGYADSADLGNPASLAPNTIELRYTVIGDTNLDGTVGGADYAAVVQNYNTGTKWDQGDVTYELKTGGADYAAVVQHYGNSATSPAATPSATPAAAAPTLSASIATLSSPLSPTTDDSGKKPAKVTAKPKAKVIADVTPAKIRKVKHGER